MKREERREKRAEREEEKRKVKGRRRTVRGVPRKCQVREWDWVARRRFDGSFEGCSFF